MIRVALLSLVSVFALANPASAQQVWVTAGAGYLLQSDDISDVVTFSHHLETAVVDGTYPGSGGALIDVGAAFTVAPQWSVAGGVGVFRSNADVLLRGRVPHPLYFASPREVEHEMSGVDRTEVTLRGELAYTQPLFTRLNVTLSGGPIAVRASQDFASAITARERVYPYDDVELVPSERSESHWGIGGTVALDASWSATPRVAVGLTARYSRATVSLRDHDVDVAGPSVIGAVKFRLR